MILDIPHKVVHSITDSPQFRLPHIQRKPKGKCRGKCLGKCVPGIGRMRVSDTHWIGVLTAGSSRMSVGYAVKHALRCGFGTSVRRMCTGACSLARVWHKRASDTHLGVRLGAGLAQTCVGCALKRVPGACSTSLCVICASGRASGACSVHTRVGYAPKRGTVFLHVVTASIGAALSGRTFPAGLATGRQDQLHACRDSPHLPRRSCQSPAIGGGTYIKRQSRGTRFGRKEGELDSGR